MSRLARLHFPTIRAAVERSTLPRYFLSLLLAWSLVLSPLVHALGMARAAQAAEPVVVSHCHHEQTPVQVDCCCHKGSVCHCALPAGLPAAPSLVPQGLGQQDRPLGALAYHPRTLPPPEPPPPRA